MMRPPMAAWMGTSNIWRGMSSLSFSLMRRPYSSAFSRCTTVENASTGTEFNKMSTFTRSERAYPDGS